MRKRVHIVLRGLIGFLVAGAAGSSNATEPLSINDVVRLVNAGVGPSIIEYQVRRSGLDFDIDVDAIIALRTARADDRLIRFLMDVREASEDPPASPSISGSTAEPPRDDGIRLVRSRAPSGGETVTLTNMSSDGRPVSDRYSAPVRGIISSSTVSGQARSASELPRAVEGRRQIEATDNSLTVPAAIDVTIRHEEDAGQVRVRALEERLEDLEQRRDPADRPAVGTNFPQHPINGQRDYPIVGPGGYSVLVPFAFAPQAFRVHASGPFGSFTSAARGGVDVFAAPQPCQRGQACSVARRLAHPQR